MREYGRVFSCVWSSTDFRSLTDDGRMLALYLMTCPHATIAGVFRLPDGYVCEDLQWTVERVSEGFRNLVAKGFANRCETSKWVWICKHLEWNPPENPNQAKGARKAALQIPDECAWKLEYMRVCGHLIGLKGSVNQNPSETLSEPFRNTESESESESEPDNGSAAPTDPPSKLRTRSAPKAEVPDDFHPKPETVAKLRAEWGMSDEDIGRCRTVFLDQCRAKGYRYVDANAAFSNCVRGDWQGCRTRAPATAEQARYV